MIKIPKYRGKASEYAENYIKKVERGEWVEGYCYYDEGFEVYKIVVADIFDLHVKVDEDTIEEV